MRFEFVCMRYLKLILIFFSSLVVFLFVGRGVNAIAYNVSVDKGKFEIEAKRGEVIDEKIIIFNKGNDPLPLTARVSNFGAEDETGKITFDEDSQDPSFNSRLWFKIENPYFILNPKESRAIKFKITVPQEAEPGGHYAAMLFEPQISSLNFEQGQAQVIPVIGVLFLTSVNVEGVYRSANPLTIAEFLIPEKFHLKKVENFISSIGGIFSEALAENRNAFSVVENGNLSFSLRLKNDDIYHIKPAGKLTIVSLLTGVKAGETEVEKNTILPKKTRNFPINFTPDLFLNLDKYLPQSISKVISAGTLWGKYRASLELEVGGRTYFKTIDFWIFPWKAAVVLLIILIFLILIRRRISAAIRVLFNLKFKNQNAK